VVDKCPDIAQAIKAISFENPRLLIPSFIVLASGAINNIS
jgi:hypothetical protein